MPFRVPKEENVRWGRFLNERFAIKREPGAFLKWRRSALMKFYLV